MGDGTERDHSQPNSEYQSGFMLVRPWKISSMVKRETAQTNG